MTVFDPVIVDPRFVEATGYILSMSPHDILPGVELQTTAQGLALMNWMLPGVPPTADAVTAALAALDKAAANAVVQAQIDALELKQARPIREAALGDTSAASRIATINTQIVALRAQLQA